jgi:hypothetical protein
MEMQISGIEIAGSGECVPIVDVRVAPHICETVTTQALDRSVDVHRRHACGIAKLALSDWKREDDLASGASAMQSRQKASARAG